MRTRFSVAVIFLVAAIFLVGSLTPAQQATNSNLRPELNELLTKRRDVLRTLVEALEKRMSMGLTKVDSVVPARELLLSAELQLAATQKERLEIYQKRIDNMRELEDSLRIQHKAGDTNLESVLTTTAARLQAEIDLAREKE